MSENWQNLVPKKVMNWCCHVDEWLFSPHLYCKVGFWFHVWCTIELGLRDTHNELVRNLSTRWCQICFWNSHWLLSTQRPRSENYCWNLINALFNLLTKVAEWNVPTLGNPSSALCHVIFSAMDFVLAPYEHTIWLDCVTIDYITLQDQLVAVTK